MSKEQMDIKIGVEVESAKEIQEKLDKQLEKVKGDIDLSAFIKVDDFKKKINEAFKGINLNSSFNGLQGGFSKVIEGDIKNIDGQIKALKEQFGFKRTPNGFNDLAKKLAKEVKKGAEGSKEEIEKLSKQMVDVAMKEFERMGKATDDTFKETQENYKKMVDYIKKQNIRLPKELIGEGREFQKAYEMSKTLGTNGKGLGIKTSKDGKSDYEEMYNELSSIMGQGVLKSPEGTMGHLQAIMETIYETKHATIQLDSEIEEYTRNTIEGFKKQTLEIEDSKLEMKKLKEEIERADKAINDFGKDTEKVYDKISKTFVDRQDGSGMMPSKLQEQYSKGDKRYVNTLSIGQDGAISKEELKEVDDYAQKRKQVEKDIAELSKQKYDESMKYLKKIYELEEKIIGAKGNTLERIEEEIDAYTQKLKLAKEFIAINELTDQKMENKMNAMGDDFLTKYNLGMGKHQDKVQKQDESDELKRQKQLYSEIEGILKQINKVNMNNVNSGENLSNVNKDRLEELKKELRVKREILQKENLINEEREEGLKKLGGTLDHSLNTKLAKEYDKLEKQDKKDVKDEKLQKQKQLYSDIEGVMKRINKIEIDNVTAGDTLEDINNDRVTHLTKRLDVLKQILSTEGLINKEKEEGLKDLRDSLDYDLMRKMAIEEDRVKKSTSTTKTDDQSKIKKIYSDVSSILNDINKKEIQLVSSGEQRTKNLTNELNVLHKTKEEMIDKLRSNKMFNEDVEKSLDEQIAKQKRKLELARQEYDLLPQINRRTGNRKVYDLDDTLDFDKIYSKVNSPQGFKQAKNDLAQYISEMKKVDVEVTKVSKSFDKLNDEMVDIEYRLKNGDEKWETYTLKASKGMKQVHRDNEVRISDVLNRQIGFMEQLKIALERVPIWTVATTAYLGTFKVIRDGIESVRELDTAMVDLKKVTDETRDTYKEFQGTANEMAIGLGKTTSEVIEATTMWAKAGFELSKAQELAKTTLIGSNVGDSSVEDMQRYLVAPLKAFNIEANNSIKILDIMNNVSNKHAISVKDIGEAYSKSSSVMAMAGNSIEQTTALLTAAQAQTQAGGDVVGTAFKTLALRIRGMKDDDGELVVKLKEDLEAVGVAIKDDVNGGFRSTYEIIEDLSKVWNDIDPERQMYLLEKMAGKRQANILAATIANFGEAQQTLSDAITSSGSAFIEQQKYLESTEAKVNQLKASYEGLVTSIIDSGMVNSVVDLTRGFVENTKASGKLGTSVTGLMPIMLTFATVLKNIKIDKVVKGIGALSTGALSFGGAISKTLGLVTKSLGGWVAIVSIALPLIAQLVGWIKRKNEVQVENARVTLQETKQMSEQVNVMEDLIDKYDKLGDNEETALQIKRQMAKVMPEIVKGYDDEGNAIIENIDSLREYIALKKSDANNKRERAIGTISSEYDDALAKVKKYSEEIERLTKLQQNAEKSGGYVGGREFTSVVDLQGKIDSLNESKSKAIKLVEEYKEELEGLGIYVNGVSNKIKQQNDDLNKLVSQNKTMSKAIDELNSKNKLSKQTYEELAYVIPDILDYQQDEVDSIQELIRAKIEETNATAREQREQSRIVMKETSNRIASMIQEQKAMADLHKTMSMSTSGIMSSLVKGEFVEDDGLKSVKDYVNKQIANGSPISKLALGNVDLNDTLRDQIDLYNQSIGSQKEYGEQIAQNEKRLEALKNSIGSTIGEVGGGGGDKKGKDEYVSEMEIRFRSFEKSVADTNFEIDKYKRLMDGTENKSKQARYLTILAQKYQDQKDNLHELNEERRKAREELKKEMEGKGFKIGYDETGDQMIIENAEIVKKAIGDKAKAMEDLIEKMDDYNSSIRESGSEWYDWNKEIEEISEKLKKLKEDLYDDIEDVLKDQKGDHLKYLEEKHRDEINEIKDDIKDIEEQRKEIIDALKENSEKDLGFDTDAFSDNVEDLILSLDILDEKLQGDSTSFNNTSESVRSDLNEIKDEVLSINEDLEGFLDYDTSNKDKLKSHIEDEQEYAEDLKDKIEDINDALRDKERLYRKQEAILEKEIEQLEEAEEKRHKEAMENLEEEHKKQQKIINDKLESLQDEAETEDYKKALSKEQDELQKLQNQLDNLMLDDSLEAKAKRQLLEEQYNEQLEKIQEMQSERERKLREDNLQDQLDAIDDEYENQKEALEDQHDLEEERIDNKKDALEDMKELHKQELEALKLYKQSLESLYGSINSDIKDKIDKLDDLYEKDVNDLKSKVEEKNKEYQREKDEAKRHWNEMIDACQDGTLTFQNLMNRFYENSLGDLEKYGSDVESKVQKIKDAYKDLENVGEEEERYNTYKGHKYRITDSDNEHRKYIEDNNINGGLDAYIEDILDRVDSGEISKSKARKEFDRIGIEVDFDNSSKHSSSSNKNESSNDSSKKKEEQEEESDELDEIREIARRNNVDMGVAKDMYETNKRLGYNKYKNGGLVDYTGPAWVDGSPDDPEAFLNSEQTKAMSKLKEYLPQLLEFVKNPIRMLNPKSSDIDMVNSDSKKEQVIDIDVNIREFKGTESEYNSIGSKIISGMRKKGGDV